MKLTTDRHEASRGLFATAELLVNSRVNKGIQSATKMLPLKRGGGVAHRLLQLRLHPAFAGYASC